MTSYPLAIDARNNVVYWHPDSTPHLSISGRPGSGKTEAVATLICDALRHGDEVYLVDTSSTDHSWAEPWLTGRAINLDEAEALVQGISREASERWALLHERGIHRLADLPAAFRPPRIILFIEELIDALTVTEVIAMDVIDRLDEPERSIAREERERVIDENARVAFLRQSVNRIAREAAGVDVHLVFTYSQGKASATHYIPGFTELLTNTGRLLLGPASSPQRRRGLADPSKTPALPHGSPSGAGVWEPLNESSTLVHVDQLNRTDAAAMITETLDARPPF